MAPEAAAREMAVGKMHLELEMLTRQHGYGMLPF